MVKKNQKKKLKQVNNRSKKFVESSVFPKKISLMYFKGKIMLKAIVL